MTVLRPGVRTYKPRRSRISARESSALQAHQTRDDRAGLLLPAAGERLDLASVWGEGTPVVVEIGFGSGTATAAMATADPGTGILAIDVHTPGIGDLLWRLDESGARNVRVIEGDALEVLQSRIPPASLAGVRSYFPDPWPKARHHKRRLVQPAVLSLVSTRLEPGGTWHLATDWPEYAEQAGECFAAEPGWHGGVIDRPSWRPVTPFERRALRDGRPVVDLLFTWQPDGQA